jgi:hypothetical protein
VPDITYPIAPYIRSRRVKRCIARQQGAGVVGTSLTMMTSDITLDFVNSQEMRRRICASSVSFAYLLPWGSVDTGHLRGGVESVVGECVEERLEREDDSGPEAVGRGKQMGLRVGKPQVRWNSFEKNGGRPLDTSSRDIR